MATATQLITKEKFSFSSSIAADVWHAKENSKAFEWWYFDALSEDGRDAVVINFSRQLHIFAALQRRQPQAV